MSSVTAVTEVISISGVRPDGHQTEQIQIITRYDDGSTSSVTEDLLIETYTSKGQIKTHQPNGRNINLKT